MNTLHSRMKGGGTDGVDLADYGVGESRDSDHQLPKKQETLNRESGQSLTTMLGLRAKALPCNPSYVYHTLIIRSCQRSDLIANHYPDPKYCWADCFSVGSICRYS